MTFRAGIAIAMALAASAGPAVAQTAPAALAPAGQEADHVALRQLKTDLLAAINKQDFEAARKLVHQPMLTTAVTQDSFNDFDKLVGFYKSLFTRENLRMKKVHLTADADELSQIYTGTFAVTRGSTREYYELASGRGFHLKGRWTATSVKEPDGRWQLLAIHSGTNFLANPVLAAAEKMLVWAAAIAGVLGLLLGFLAGRFTRRRRAAGTSA